jgi:hypothetical protein
LVLGASAARREISYLLPQQAGWDERKGDDPSLEELHIVADRWGEDPVHPPVDTYCVMAEKLEE